MEAEDGEQFAEILEEEEELLANLIDGVGQLLKLNGEEFMPVFESKVVAPLAPYLSSEQPVPLQIIAVCMLDDAIEFGGASGHKYIPQTLSSLYNNLTSEDTILQQSSVYGIGQSIKVAPQSIASDFANILQSLMNIIQHPEAKDDERGGSTENALFAIGSILCNPSFRGEGT